MSSLWLIIIHCCNKTSCAWTSHELWGLPVWLMRTGTLPDPVKILNSVLPNPFKWSFSPVLESLLSPFLNTQRETSENLQISLRSDTLPVASCLFPLSPQIRETRRLCLAPPLSVIQPGNAQETIIWEIGKPHLICFLSLRDRYSSLACVQHLEAYTFFQIFSCFRWEDKSNSCYSILPGSRSQFSIWLFSIKCVVSFLHPLSISRDV